MDFESLIWIVAVLIWVVSAVIKKKRAAPEPKEKAATKKRPEWREKLDGFLTQIKKQMQGELNDTPPTMEISRKEMETMGGFSEFLEKRAGKEPYYQDIELSADDISYEGMETVPEEPAPVDTEPEIEAPSRPESVLRYDIKDLRKAIIWSEILGPPVALKNH
ncbi:hypothetical protein ACFL0O_07070 [Thermodesulfobacteriota bacterium]